MTSAVAIRDARAEAASALLALMPVLRRRFQAALPQDIEAELCKVTQHQGEALYHLRNAGGSGMTMNELARAQRCALSTATAMVDRLIRQGLAERVHDSEDRRVVRIIATGRGEELTRRFAEVKRQVALHALEPLSDSEVTSLLALLRRIADAPEATAGVNAE
jgi:DNA-binding MarR family transcriptional regulator